MKRAPRTLGASADVRRGQSLAFAAAGTVIAALVVALGGAALARGKSRRFEPSPPHRAAKVSCTSCHVPGAAVERGVPASACVSCHGPHPSTRGPHRRLQEAGELRCGSCHPIHAADEGVVFPPAGAPSRFRGTVVQKLAPGPFRAPEKTVVPLVGKAACLSCHQPDKPGDPAHRCFAPGSTVDGCFDEHRRPLAEPTRGGGVCSAQHEGSRAFAWEAARTIATTTSPPVAGSTSGTLALLTAIAGALGGALGLVFARRRAGTKSVSINASGGEGGGETTGQLVATDRAPARRVRLPRIDESRCLGCFACVDACPYDVLAVEGYVAKVVREDACCGVVLCQQRCPNGSLVIAEGEIRPDVPPLTEALESELVPGVFLAGDVTGGSLIKNAIRQGTASVDAMGPVPRVEGTDVDVLVVGAGPAGIAAALRAKEKGLRAVVIERGSVAESIRSFPRGKLVFDQPLDLPAVGKLWLEESTKEELLAQWTRIVRKERLDVREGRTLLALRRDEEAGCFVVETAASADLDALGGEPARPRTKILRASRIVLAIGRRGAVRKLPLPIPEEALSQVHYHLADARSFEGKRAVVVGLGDVAMETALALAEQTGTTVTLVHRGAEFSRGSARNVAAVQARAAAGKLRLLLRTEVLAIDEGRLVVSTDKTAENEAVEADAVFVMIGTEPPRALLERLGVLSGDPSLESSV